ncbi:hypothetical protein [Nocardia sp. N2S4-5]|uniref:hypothetical protein n=1 Tax=Nocardia sp. N2S4-5 TaxID=3351565 RepID=UPI0037D44DC5
MTVQVSTHRVLRLPNGELASYKDFPLQFDHAGAEEALAEGIEEAGRLGLADEFRARTEIMTQYKVEVTLEPGALGDAPTFGEIGVAVRVELVAWALGGDGDSENATGTESER